MIQRNNYIGILLALLVTVSPIASGETLQGRVSKSHGVESLDKQDGTVQIPNQETGTVEMDQPTLDGQAAGTDPQSTQFNLQAPTLSGGASHGEEPIGVLGCQVLTTFLAKHTGLILQIYPGSDLLSYGIHPGDKILRIDGRRFVARDFSSDCRGMPGTRVNLLILHDGQEIEFSVMRKDARQFAHFDQYYRHWADQTKYW
jgi:hypothetical protein